MINRFKIIWGEQGSLKNSWINFLGMFLYYLHGIDVHNHIYYSRKYDYCYTIRPDGLIFQQFSIPTGSVRLKEWSGRYKETKEFMDAIHNDDDKCVMCNQTRTFP